MNYIRDTFDFSIREPAAVALGKFDGLHRGHKRLLDEAKKGKAHGEKSVAFTFDISPKTLSEPDHKVLLTNREKEQVFSALGIDYVVECPFTEKLRRMDPHAFLAFLTERIETERIVAGSDFCFGYERRGTCRDLRDYEAEFGYRTTVIEKIQWEGTEISSSRIRALIGNAELSAANRLLGYPYFLTGEVRYGTGIGRKMGIPTVNQIAPADKLLPPDGVYASLVTAAGRTWYGVTDIGTKPTIGGDHPRGVETHILDFDGRIYGQEIRVAFLSFLREERVFASVEELRVQIGKDCAAARDLRENGSLQPTESML